MAGAIVSFATVAVPGVANAVVCGQPTAATLAQVITLGSCTVGDKTFSGFSYLQDGFTGLIQGIPNVPATAVGIGPASTPDIGLAFNAGWTNSNTAGIAADAAITFTAAITPPAGTTLITDAQVQIQSGFGSFQDIESFPGTSIA
jgi:hypothetical protein